MNIVVEVRIVRGRPSGRGKPDGMSLTYLINHLTIECCTKPWKGCISRIDFVMGRAALEPASHIHLSGRGKD